MRKIITLCLVVIFTFYVGFTSISCQGTSGETVSKSAYDALQSQLTAAQAEVTELKNKLAAAVTPPTNVNEQALKDQVATLNQKITDLGNQVTQLNAQKESLTQEKNSLETKYNQLNTSFLDLQNKMGLTALPANTTMDDIENAIMNLLNQERQKAGVGDFLLGQHLHDQARQNSKNMSIQNKEIFDSAVFYQEVLWAAGYTTVDSIARGALLRWKLDQYKFEHGALSPIHKYGAVGAYRSGDVIYITFYAASFA